MDYIFFDFNGTILDDRKVCLNLLNEMLMMKNHPPIDEERYLDIFTFPVINYYQKAGFTFPKDNFKELAKYFIVRYQQESINSPIFYDVENILIKLKKTGKKLFILSASQKDMLVKQLKMYQIYDYFDAVIGKDNIYASGKEELGVDFMEKNKLDKSKCIFIGDTLHDEETANAMGIKCILISRGHQSKKVLQQGNSIVLDSLKEINF